MSAAKPATPDYAAFGREVAFLLDGTEWDGDTWDNIAASAEHYGIVLRGPDDQCAPSVHAQKESTP